MGFDELVQELIENGESHDDAVAAAMLSFGVESEHSFFLEQFDCFHFNLFHIEEAGFRVAAGDHDDDEKTGSLMDRVVQRARAFGTYFDSERLSRGKNSKFTIYCKIEEMPQCEGTLCIKNDVN